MSLETRKLQMAGYSTYILSLPKPWVMARGLRKGDPIGLRMMPDGTIRLFIEPGKGACSPAELDTVAGKDRLAREFIGCYLAGYPGIVFRLGRDRAADQRNIRELVHLVAGMEITEESGPAVTVRDIIDSGVLTPEKAVRRMVMVCTSMIEDVLSGAPVEARTERAIGREGAVDRLNWLVARQYHLVLTDVQFTHKVELTPRKGLGYLLVARALERISDHARDIAAGRVPPAAAGPGKALPGVLERTVESFLSGSLDGADAAVDEAERLLSELGTLLDTAVSEGNPPAAANDAAFLYGLGRICSYTKDIGEIAVNQSMLGAD